MNNTPFRTCHVNATTNVSERLRTRNSLFLPILPSLRLNINANNGDRRRLSATTSNEVNSSRLLNVTRPSDYEVRRVPSALRPTRPVCFVGEVVVFQRQVTKECREN